MSLPEIRRQLRARASPAKARVLRSFFKTGPGEYGENDVFLGVQVPDIRRIARDCRALPLADVRRLLTAKVHEERMLALIVLCDRFARADEGGRRALHAFYLAHTRFVNNWDLVDISAPRLVGAFLAGHDARPLDRLARSSLLWERRIAIVATLEFIRRRRFAPTLRIARTLLADPHDLIHKAVGWMLREVGKRDVAVEAAFLARHHARMPRTMLRYAIERFPEARRRSFLAARMRP